VLFDWENGRFAPKWSDRKSQDAQQEYQFDVDPLFGFPRLCREPSYAEAAEAARQVQPKDAKPHDKGTVRVNPNQEQRRENP